MKFSDREKLVNSVTIKQLNNTDNNVSVSGVTAEATNKFLMDIINNKLENYNLLKIALKDNFMYFHNLLILIQDLSDNNKLKVKSISNIISNLINVVSDDFLHVKKYKKYFADNFKEFSAGEVVLKELNKLALKYTNKNLNIIPHIESAFIFEKEDRFADLVYFLLNNIINFSQDSSEIKILSCVKGDVYKFSVVCDLNNKKFCAKDFENCFELAFAKYIVKQQKGVIKYSLLNENILVFEFSILS